MSARAPRSPSTERYDFGVAAGPIDAASRSSLSAARPTEVGEGRGEDARKRVSGRRECLAIAAIAGHLLGTNFPWTRPPSDP